MRREEAAVAYGDFRPRELLAEGKTAVVYRAEGTRGPAALKLFRKPLSSDAGELVRHLEALDHPHLIRFFAHGEDWVAMEFFDAPNLEEILGEGRLPVARALRLAARMADGLGALHAAGWVHRDLKPSNAMVTEGDHPKIIDFGLARREGTEPTEASFEGSWGYSAPEQILGGEADPRSDVYALGVILYHMLVGHLPFGAAPVAAALGHLHDRPPPPRSLDPSIPPAVETLLLRALAKDPEARFPSMEDFADALRACEKALGVEPEPSRRPWIPAVGALVALVLLAAQLAC